MSLETQLSPRLDLPVIACSLGQEELAERRARWRALVAQCCAFARFEVRSPGEQVLLDVTAPSEGVLVVQEMFS
jgi:hypothetical protein